MAVFISSKFSNKKPCKYNDLELEYGFNAFRSLQEVLDMHVPISDVVFVDSKVTLTGEYGDVASLYGNADIATDGFIKFGDDSNVPGKNSLRIKDANSISTTRNFNKVELDNSSLYSVIKDDYYTSKLSKANEYGECTETRTYKTSGTVTAKNSHIEDITNYATVNLTNTSVNNITCASARTIKSSGQKEEDYFNGYITSATYTAGGTLNITLDKNAEDTEYYIGAINGYNKVTITGLNPVKNPDKNGTIRVGMAIVGGLPYWQSEIYSDNPNRYLSSGTINISNNVTVNGNINYFTNVTVASGSNTLSILNGDGKYSKSIKETKKKYTEDDYSWYEYTTTVTGKTALSGTVTITDSSVNGSISNYKTVKITNSNTGSITQNTLTKTVKKYIGESSYKTYESSNWDECIDPLTTEQYYTSDGSLTVKANAAYSINAAGEIYTPEYYIKGYANVTVFGYKTVKISGKSDEERVTIYGDIFGGDAVVTFDYFNGNSTTLSSSGSATLTNTDVGAVCGYTTVKLTNCKVDKVDKLDDKSTVKEKVTTEKWKDEDYEYKVEQHTITETFKKEGSLTAVNSTIARDIVNYQTVNLTNTSTRDIIRDMRTVKIDEYEIWNGDDEYAGNNTKITVKSGGSVTVKLDKNATDNVSVGKISGYEKVTLTGFTDKKNQENDKRISADIISGGNAIVYAWDDYYDDEYDEAVCGSVKLDQTDAKGIYGYKTVALTNSTISENGIVAIFEWYEDDEMLLYYGSEIETESKSTGTHTFKSADKVTVTHSSVAGQIAGYGNVTVTDSKIRWVEQGVAFTFKDSWSSKGDFSTWTLSYTATKTSSATIKNSFVNGTIDNYAKVTLLNTSVWGDIRQAMLHKVTSIEYYNYDEGIDESNTEFEYKAAGSITISADKNAKEEYYDILGDISGYEKVTINGYEGKDGVNAFIYIRNIVGGSFTSRDDELHYFMDMITSSMDDTINGQMTGCKATGSVTIKNNVTVYGNICGYDKVTLTDVDIYGTINAAPYNFDTSGTSVTLNGEVDVQSIKNYKKVTVAKGINYIDYIGTEGTAETLTVSKGAILYIDGNASLNDSNDKLVVNGTIVVGGSGNINVSGKKQISGSGEIAADSATVGGIDSVGTGKVKLVNLGDTTAGFVSSVLEAADNTSKKAVKWDGTEEYTGWLSGGGSDDTGIDILKDTTDFVKLTAKQDGFLFASGDIDLWINNSEWDGSDFAITAGDSYLIKLERKEENSVSYQLNLA